MKEGQVTKTVNESLLFVIEFVSASQKSKQPLFERTTELLMYIQQAKFVANAVTFVILFCGVTCYLFHLFMARRPSDLYKQILYKIKKKTNNLANYQLLSKKTCIKMNVDKNSNKIENSEDGSANLNEQQREQNGADRKQENGNNNLCV